MFDVVIIGGGPAGACAALRLLALGHRVALIEQQAFPRPQIGESLSVGVRNIFNYLGAEQLLNRHEYIEGLSAKVIWEKEGEVHTLQKSGGIMVNRGKLDEDLISLAVSRGLELFQPAKLESCVKLASHWEVVIRQELGKSTLKGVFILDARGRSGLRTMDKIITAAPMVALYAHTNRSAIPECTLVEAQESGWLWGSPLPGPDQKFRMMVFLSPEELRKRDLEQVFREKISSSILFKGGLNDLGNEGIQSCSVSSYSHQQPWENNYIRIGEAAFTLDPLSSTGMEKAMRFSLQTVIALNTILKSGDAQMAQSYYEDKLVESLSLHLNWTSNYYSTAWPGKGFGFWKERSQMNISLPQNDTAFYHKLASKLRAKPGNEVRDLPTKLAFGANIDQVWYKEIRLSPQISYTRAVCVEDDRLQIREAVQHPSLSREITYIDNIAVPSLLKESNEAETVGELIYLWTKHMPFEQAKAMAIQLHDLDLLEIG